MNKKKIGIVLLCAVCFFACSDGRFKSADTVVDLSISFTDTNWDGKKIPKIGQCTNCGGKGLSPPLRISNIPKNTEFLILEFKDKTMVVYHGAVRIPITSNTELTVPSFKEQTYDLPMGIEMEKEHNAPIGAGGVYMAPCGCGYNNKYMAYVFALRKDDSGQIWLLGKGEIKLGRF